MAERRRCEPTAGAPITRAREERIAVQWIDAHVSIPQFVAGLALVIMALWLVGRGWHRG